MASLDHRGRPTQFPGDGNSPQAIIDREFNYYGEDFYFYSGGVLTSARTLIGGGVPPNIVLQNTGGFTAGRIPFAAANGYALVDSANLTWDNGTNTLGALNLEVNGGNFTVLPGAGVTTLNSAITRINNNNFAMPQFAAPDQYKLLWVSNGATSSVGTTPYTMPPTAGGLPPNGRRILQSNGSNYVNSGYGLPTAAGTSGTYLMSDGTDYFNTPYKMPLNITLPNTLLVSNGVDEYVPSLTLQAPVSAASTTNRPLVSNGIAGDTKYMPYEIPSAQPGAAGLVMTSTGATTAAWSAPATTPVSPLFISGLAYHALNVGSIFSPPYGVWNFNTPGAIFNNSSNGTGTIDYYFQGIDTTGGGTTWTVQPIIEQYIGTVDSGLRYDILLDIAGGGFVTLGATGIVPTATNQQASNQRTLPSTIIATNVCQLRLAFTETIAPHGIRITGINIWRSV